MFHANCLREKPAQFGFAKRAGEKSFTLGTEPAPGGCHGWQGSPSCPTLRRLVPSTLLAHGSSSAAASQSRAPVSRASVSAPPRQPCPAAGGGCVPAPHPSMSPSPAQPLQESRHEMRRCLGVLSTSPNQPRGWHCSGSTRSPLHAWLLAPLSRKPPQPQPQPNGLRRRVRALTGSTAGLAAACK